ncbi:MAG: hypothetical protein QOH47_169 [Sphingomonadales bacterium]|nr:hypothetical protein [Sphingomonadales bacterium]
MAQDTGTVEAFVRQISELNIEISKSAAGLYTVCSTAEPLFCYDGETIEELEVLVQDTVRSYGKHFFNIELPPFSTESEPLDAGPLPIERATPVSRIKPVFDLAA